MSRPSRHLVEADESSLLKNPHDSRPQKLLMHIVAAHGAGGIQNTNKAHKTVIRNHRHHNESLKIIDTGIIQLKIKCLVFFKT